MITISHVVSSTSEVNQITSEVIFAPDGRPLRGRSLQRWAIRRFVVLRPPHLRLLKFAPFGDRCSLSFVMLHLRGEYQFVMLPRLCKTHFRVNSTVTAESQQMAKKLRHSFGGWRSFMYFCNPRGWGNLKRPSLVPTKLFLAWFFLLEDFILNRSLDGMVFDKASHTPHGVPEVGEVLCTFAMMLLGKG